MASVTSIVGGTAALAGVATAILLAPARSIATIIPDCVVEENHRDDLRTTEHPVELGAAVTDHAYKMPAELTVRAGWTNSILAALSPTSLLSNSLSQDVSNAASAVTEARIKLIYQQLLDLQASRQLFKVVTGKRTYPNMLMTGLSVQTDQSLEYTLMAVMTFKQLIVVQTQTTSVPPQAQHAAPQQTAPTQQQGTQTPQSPASPPASLLSHI